MESKGPFFFRGSAVVKFTPWVLSGGALCCGDVGHELGDWFWKQRSDAAVNGLQRRTWEAATFY